MFSFKRILLRSPQNVRQIKFVTVCLIYIN